jgi:putative Mn2+ efflux pump MntP
VPALLLLAVALGLSNFAAAIGIGVSGVRGGLRVRIAVVFGLFEAGMPVLGLVLGHGLASDLGAAARWLGGAVLIAVGAISLLLARRGATVERSPVPRNGHGGQGGSRLAGWR